MKKTRGIITFLAIIGLMFTLAVCDNGSIPPDGSGSGAALFSGNFEGSEVGVIQIFSEEQAASSVRSRNFGALDTRLFAAIEVDENGTVLKLEGPYDPVSGMFNLSARTEEGIYMLSGTMDGDREFYSPVVTILRPQDGDWKGEPARVMPEPEADFTTRDFTTVPSSDMPSAKLVIGRNAVYTNYEARDEEEHNFILLLSPAGVVSLYRQQGGPNDGCWVELDNTTVHEIERISDREIHIIYSYNRFTITNGVNDFPTFMTAVGFDRSRPAITIQELADISGPLYEIWLLENNVEHTRMYSKRGYIIAEGGDYDQLMLTRNLPNEQHVTTLAAARDLTLPTGSPLPAPENLRVENKILKWDPVDNAVSYMVQFGYSYSDMKLPAEGTTFNLSVWFPVIEEHPFPSYNVNVWAIAADGQDVWGDGSYASIQLTPEGDFYVSPLMTPTNLTVRGKTISWVSNDENAYSFTLRISTGGTVTTILDNSGMTYDLPASYNTSVGFVQVKAVPANSLNADSEYSDWVSFGTEAFVPILDVLQALCTEKGKTPVTQNDLSAATTWEDLVLPMGYDSIWPLTMEFRDLDVYTYYNGSVPAAFENITDMENFAADLSLDANDSNRVSVGDILSDTPFNLSQNVVIKWRLGWGSDYDPANPNP